jgi:hypothetical protein
MISGAVLSAKGVGAEALGAPGSGEPLLRSFVSGWHLWLEIATSTVPVGSSGKSKNVWMDPFRYLPLTL